MLWSYMFPIMTETKVQNHKVLELYLINSSQNYYINLGS